MRVCVCVCVCVCFAQFYPYNFCGHFCGHLRVHSCVHFREHFRERVRGSNFVVRVLCAFLIEEFFRPNIATGKKRWTAQKKGMSTKSEKCRQYFRDVCPKTVRRGGKHNCGYFLDDFLAHLVVLFGVTLSNARPILP